MLLKAASSRGFSPTASVKLLLPASQESGQRASLAYVESRAPACSDTFSTADAVRLVHLNATWV
jgi:hypothetical protein